MPKGGRIERPVSRLRPSDLADLGPCAQYPPGSSKMPQALAPDRLYRCPDCGLGQRHPYPDEAILAAAYRETEVNSLEYNFADNAAWYQALDLLSADSSSQAKTILDVGCHSGLFLAGLPQHWRRFGIESAHDPLQLAMEQHGVEIIAERIESVPARWNGQFDVVTLFDVFEHLVFPLDGLRRVSELVRPGGRLIIITSDMDAWTWRLAAGQHWYLQTPLHLSFGSRRYFRRLPRWLPLHLHSLWRIPHQHGTNAIRRRQAVELIYWQCRQRGGWYQLLQRLIQAFPEYRDLRHHQSPPWTMNLRDHVLVSFDRL